MKVWTTIPNTIDTGWADINIGQEVTVYRCGSGFSVFGEKAHFERTTKQHLIFVTESGAEVKTKIDNLFAVVGKAHKAHYCVTLKKFEDFDTICHEKVMYWNGSKCVFEKK